MLAWFYKNLEERNSNISGVDPLTVYYAWVERKEAEGRVKFEIKKPAAAREGDAAGAAEDEASLRRTVNVV